MADTPFHNPFGALAHLRGETQSETEAPKPVPAPSTSAAEVKPIARAVVRIERTGRGGKEVTVVDHLDLPVMAMERWLKDLKSALGCGGTMENGAIVLQGDHRKRLPAVLAAKGVKKVTTAK